MNAANTVFCVRYIVYKLTMIGSFTSLQSGSFETMIFTNNVIKNNIIVRVSERAIY